MSTNFFFLISISKFSMALILESANLNFNSFLEVTIVPLAKSCSANSFVVPYIFAEISVSPLFIVVQAAGYGFKPRI